MDFSAFVSDAVAKLQALPAGGDVLEQVFRSPFLQRTGTWVEFGVAGGDSLRRLSAQRGNAKLWGFDTFTGLPEDWRPEPQYQKGAFAVDAIPRVPGAHLVTGLFGETLSCWCPDSEITFAHIDCDLYSASKCALDRIWPYLADGAILVFDEFYNYPGFEKGEIRALYEVVEEQGMPFRWLFNHGGPPVHPNERAAILVPG